MNLAVGFEKINNIKAKHSFHQKRKATYLTWKYLNQEEQGNLHYELRSPVEALQV